MRVCLLNPYLDQCFLGTSSDRLVDLDPLKLLVTLETHLLAILLKSAAGKHLKNGLTAFFRKQPLRALRLRLSIDWIRG